jgi:prepilin-type N-terminal cleavage/methylation domain-containing protein
MISSAQAIMKTINFDVRSRKWRGFTLIELLVVIATVAVLTCLLLPVLAQTGKRALRIQCVNNLKLINLSFHVWEGNQGGKYPTAISTANGGAMENIFSQLGGLATAGYGLTNVFCVMSNDLTTPKNCYCPADIAKTTGPGDVLGHTTALNCTGPVANVATNWGGFSLAHLSYFVEGNATDKFPKMTIIGDRNIGDIYNNTFITGANIGTVPADYMNMMNGGYANAAVPGLVSGGLQFNAYGWAWTDKDIHQDCGNIGLTDGSVQQASLKGLVNALSDNTDAWGSQGLPYKNTILNMP